jgi:paraquat-inducible protein B
MSKKADATVVGLFVLGAILIAVGAIVFFGTTKLFTKEKRMVCYFQQSVAGLQIGSAVKFKGVPIGQVTKIQIRFNPDATTYVKIIFDIDADTVVNSLGADVNLFDDAESRRQDARGMRATLAYESFITGVLYLELDYHQDVPPPMYFEGKGSEGREKEFFAEVPTLPSNLEAIMDNATKALAKLSKIDFEALGQELQVLLQTANHGLSQIQFGELSAAIKRTADSISGFASSPDLKNTILAAHAALDNLSQTLITLQAQIDPLSKKLLPALEEWRKTAVQVNSVLAPQGDLRYQLSGTLSQVGDMAKSLQRLSEFLERNPNALIFGRKPQAKSQQP